MSTHRRIWVAGWLAAILLALGFSLLGGWQWRRMHEKQAMLDRVQAVTEARQAVPLAHASDPARARDYAWSAGSGRFADGAAWLLDNQQRDGRPGVRVYRVFLPEGDARPLLVELGWLPMPPNRQLAPLAPMPGGSMTLSGLLMPPPSRGVLGGESVETPAGHLVIGLDPAKMAAQSGVPALAPRILRPDPGAPFGYARDMDVLPNTLPPEKHLGYAVQWFALAAAVLVTALVLTLRAHRP